MALKRNREDDQGDVESLAMNNCMRLLVDKPPTRAFKCKICDQQFNSFQALGGHTAGHSTKPGEPPKSQKTHRCSICGDLFGSGQALGGHMRKHRSTSDTTVRADVADPKEGLKEIIKTNCRSLDLDLNLLPNLLHYEDLTLKEKDTNLDNEDLTLKDNNNLDRIRLQERDFELEYYEFF